MQNSPRRVRTREAAKYVGLSKSTLDKFRLEGGGPAYLKLGRAVVYDTADLDAWCAASRRKSTIQNANGAVKRQAVPA